MGFAAERINFFMGFLMVFLSFSLTEFINYAILKAMDYLNQPIEKHLNDLAAKLPAPGGGSASALAGAEGAALLSMVLNFTIDKKGYEDFWDEAKQLLKKTEEIRRRLSSLIDEDVRAYAGFNKVFKMPKDTEDEKKKRAEAMEEGLKKAEAVPEEICSLSYEAAKLSPRIFKKGNKNLLSDVEAAMALFTASFKGGRINCEINLKSIKDAEFCKYARERLDLWQGKLYSLEMEG